MTAAELRHIAAGVTQNDAALEALARTWGVDLAETRRRLVVQIEAGDITDRRGEFASSDVTLEKVWISSIKVGGETIYQAAPFDYAAELAAALRSLLSETENIPRTHAPEGFDAIDEEERS